MKNQYFGDNKDLFKFDLLEFILKKSELEKILYIPMLTENDNTKQGNDRKNTFKYWGSKNADLLSIIEKIRNPENVAIDEISNYFNKEKQIKFEIYKNELITNKFNHNIREEYFSKLFTSSIINTLIFFDPDKGLQIKNSDEKHLLFYELINSFNCMDNNSIICFIQFFHSTIISNLEKLENDIIYKENLIKSKVSKFVQSITNKNICFFFIAKTALKHQQLFQIINNYSENYK
jgi:hypothetical protein